MADAILPDARAVSASISLCEQDGKILSWPAYRAAVFTLRQQVRVVERDEAWHALRIADAFRHAVISAPVLFSGGVDSSTIALLANGTWGRANKGGRGLFVITVGARDAPDVVEARAASKALGLRQLVVDIDQEMLKATIPKVVAITKSADVTRISVGLVTYVGLAAAKREGYRLVQAGLGSEELFAGYRRHRQAEDLEDACWQGLLSMYHRDLLRDIAIADALGVRVHAPFLRLNVVQVAMQVPARYRIVEGTQKHVFRMTAEHMGLPANICWRKKLAAQYGSRMVREMRKLSRREGHATMRDYLGSLLFDLGTMHERRVWAVAKEIPEGSVSTYGEIARIIGSSPRTVGHALTKNPYSWVPCHRVIKSDGSLGGFARGMEEKQRLLRSEGVSVLRGKVITPSAGDEKPKNKDSQKVSLRPV
ncbi:hypothetical protein AUJ68_03675 [Candidatus Woesearchaeota archaeon CG1_02_57_44]|nr:MAG: hypothetical protein AUJ68_03675 [Candidatus Woesearchaeota archaeon CG1_02_57_44]